MNRPRGRPARGSGLLLDAILDAALVLLDEGEAALSMRALAARLDVTPMSLYHHVADRAALLRALSDRVYGAVVLDTPAGDEPVAEIRLLLTRYHEAVARHPQLALAIFAEPAAFAGATRELTERLGLLLAAAAPGQPMWRDILVDHAHGSALALGAAHGNEEQGRLLREHYRLALDCLLSSCVNASQGYTGKDVVS